MISAYFRSTVLGATADSYVKHYLAATGSGSYLNLSLLKVPYVYTTTIPSLSVLPTGCENGSILLYGGSSTPRWLVYLNSTWWGVNFYAIT
jgi:hypothetical protein